MKQTRDIHKLLDPRLGRWQGKLIACLPLSPWQSHSVFPTPVFTVLCLSSTHFFLYNHFTRRVAPASHPIPNTQYCALGFCSLKMLDGIQLRRTLEAKTVATLGSSWNSKLQGFFCLQGETGEGRRILGVHPECELQYTGRVELRR